jgi:probable F420-dependent oxidoreductase
MFEVFATTPETMGLEDIAAHAQRVEALGCDGLLVPDAVHDGLLLACQALTATRRIRVATSVLVAFPRSPMNVALAAWDLQRMSGGRFELGLGTQIRQNIEERYSAHWLPPASGMREYVAALRAIFHSFRSGEPLNFVGEHYRFTRLQPFFNPGPIDAPDVPIMLGAVGPKMLGLAGELADGMHTHPTNTSARYLREVILPQVSAGTQRRAPGLSAPLICACELVATGADATAVSMERERYRDLLAFLFSTPAYWPSLELHGWRAVGENLQQMTRDRRWKEMASAISETMLDEFVVSGDYAVIAGELLRRFAGLAARITFPVGEDSAHDAAIASAVRRLQEA